MYFTSKASSSEIPRQKYVKKYQHEERYKPTKCHIYIKMTTKSKLQMSCNASNINHFENNILGERQYPHKSKHQCNTMKNQILKKEVWTWRDN